MIGGCGGVVACRPLTAYDVVLAPGAQIVADASGGYFRRHNRLRECSLARGGDLRRCGATPLLTILCPSDTPLWVSGNQDCTPPKPHEPTKPSYLHEPLKPHDPAKPLKPHEPLVVGNLFFWLRIRSFCRKFVFLALLCFTSPFFVFFCFLSLCLLLLLSFRFLLF